MLFQPAGSGTFYRACEADTHRALVAALLDDPEYETAPLEARLRSRIRLAKDLVLLGRVEGHELTLSDREETASINVHTDEEFISSLHRLGLVSLASGLAERPPGEVPHGSE
ncbi:MAG TPA: hypothetical protein VIO35_05605 [Chloroflexota bacterium]|jgi:hypothetical protein